MASSSNSPCAACKYLRQKCTQECVYAPYFPPDQPMKFSSVHKVFGASNVAKLLNKLPPSQRDDAANSLAYEAEARLRDPIYGCVGVISFLQQRLKQVQTDLYNAKRELATYIGPSAMLPLTHQHPNPHLLQQNPGLIGSSMGPFGMSSLALGLPPGGGGGGAGAAGGGSSSSHQSQLVLRDQQHQQVHHHQQQHMLEAQQLAAVVAATEQQDLLRSYEQQDQLVRYNNPGGFDVAGGGAGGGVGSHQFNQMGDSGLQSTSVLVPLDSPFLVHQPTHHELHQHKQQDQRSHHDQGHQLQLQQQQQQHQHQHQQHHQQQQQQMQHPEEHRGESDEESKEIRNFRVDSSA